MNRFNQKTRESALQKEIVVLKDENNKLRHELQLMKDALLMELTEKKNQSQILESYKQELTKERQLRHELNRVYEDLLQLIDKEVPTETSATRNGKSFVPILENCNASVLSEATKQDAYLPLGLDLVALSFKNSLGEYKRKSTALTLIAQRNDECPSSREVGSMVSEPKLKTLKQLRRLLNDEPDTDLSETKRPTYSESRRVPYFEKIKQLAA